DAEQTQAVRRATQVLASALGSHRRGKAGVDDQLASAAAHQPDEVVERHRPVVRVAADEVLARAARVVRVLDRVDFVQRRAHATWTRANFLLPTWITQDLPRCALNARSGSRSP